MKQRIKQNQEIRETVENHASKKGRSKSRRQGGTTTAGGNSLYNTKTIEEYSSGIIERLNKPQQRQDYFQPSLALPFQPEIADKKKQTSRGFSNNISTYQNLSRQKERPPTTVNNNGYSVYIQAPQKVRNKNTISTIQQPGRPSFIEDYSFSQSGMGSALIASSTRTDNELERLISEKLNQRYNYKKKPIKGEECKRGAIESLSVNGAVNSSQIEDVKGNFSALKDSCSHYLVNQQLQSKASLAPSSQTQSSLITRKIKGAKNIQAATALTSQMHISTTNNDISQSLMEVRRTHQPENQAKLASKRNHQGANSTQAALTTKTRNNQRESSVSPSVAHVQASIPQMSSSEVNQAYTSYNNRLHANNEHMLQAFNNQHPGQQQSRYSTLPRGQMRPSEEEFTQGALTPFNETTVYHSNYSAFGQKVTESNYLAPPTLAESFNLELSPNIPQQQQLAKITKAANVRPLGYGSKRSVRLNNGSLEELEVIEDLQEPEEENGPRYTVLSGAHNRRRKDQDYDEDQSNSFVITSQGKGQTSITSAAKRAQSTLRPSNIGAPLGAVSSFLQQQN